MAPPTSSAPHAALTWRVFGAFSLAAVLTGCWAAGVHGASAHALMLSPVAWSVGFALALTIARAPAGHATAWLVLAAAVLAFSLFAPGLSGVHRWIGVGPARFNAAELVLPVTLVACAGLNRASLLRLLFPVLVLGVLAVQPDLSQAAATAAATTIILTTSSRPLAIKGVAGVAAVAAIVITALRPAHLDPVPDVEGIVGLAALVSPAVACLGMVAIAGAVLAPLILARAPSPPVRDAALVLPAYLAVTALAPMAGTYPVPLMGIASGPIIGAWLGVGWLMHLNRRTMSRAALT